MWNQTFMLADRIKATLLAWTVGLIIAATASDQFDSTTATTLPLSIAGVFAQTYIVVAALRVGIDPAAHAAIRPLFGRVFGISILTTLAVLLGGLLLVIPGVFLLIRWWVAVPVALDRDLRVTEAMRESWELTAPHWPSILGLFLIILAFIVIPMTGLFFLGGLDEEITSLPMSLAMNTVLYIGTMIGTVSTVGAYRTIHQPVAELRQVFE
jgi:uncharacterized membrane protein